jgi:hypothetical protein
VTAPKGKGFTGTLNFRAEGYVEIWDPVTGDIIPAATATENNRTTLTLDLPQAGSCFVIFRHDIKKGKNPVSHSAKNIRSIPLTASWTLSFPSGWGAPASLQTDVLKAWKDLDMSPEAKAFSGTVTYTTTFDAGEVKPEKNYILDLGSVEMIAAVSLNGKPLRTLWAPPYRLHLTDAIQSGVNTLTVDVTSTWFNRLVYDANLPEIERKTWTISGPVKESALRENGLLGPVVFYSEQ